MDNFIISSDKLKDICSKILTAVDNSELSVLTETLELKASNGVLSVGVTNREYFVEVKLDVTSDVDFHATVNATLFLKLISQLTTENIELRRDENTLEIVSNGTYKMPLIFEGTELLTLPKIEIENVTNEFTISASILNSILQYNSKELNKGTATRPVQRLYYVDDQGAITFTNGACVNSFTLSSPIKVLFNNKIVKLFKLFKEEEVKFTLGHSAATSDYVQTKVRFETPTITITAILPSDDSLMSQVPVSAIRQRANDTYPYTVNLNKSELIQTINRLTLFNSSTSAVAKVYGIFEFKADSVTIYDANGVNSETLKYASDSSNIEEPYTLRFSLPDFKMTLDTCNEQFLSLSFGNQSAAVLSRGNVKNVIPEVFVRDE